MRGKSSKFSIVLFAAVFVCGSVNSAFALMVGSPGGVMMVDGKDGNDTISGVSFQINQGPGYNFGFVDGAGFTSIIPNGGLSGNWGPFAAGQVVNFALQKATGTPTIYSLADVNDYADKLFEQVVNNGQPPNPSSIVTYFNTLRIDWNNIPGAFSVSILDAGSAYDGMTPIPLPPAALLFGTALIGLIVIARRSLFA